jgi:hypothetical protein
MKRRRRSHRKRNRQRLAVTCQTAEAVVYPLPGGAGVLFRRRRGAISRPQGRGPLRTRLALSLS